MLHVMQSEVNTMNIGRIFIAVLILSGLSTVPVVAQTTLRVAVGGAQAASIPFTVGAKKGIFAKHGLNVEVISITSAQMSAQAQLSGSVQLATSNPTGFFYLARQAGGCRRDCIVE
jgi:ABC-type nitrate/sulfonate/bicarbonate transport system substrate-binding protein